MVRPDSSEDLRMTECARLCGSPIKAASRRHPVSLLMPSRTDKQPAAQFAAKFMQPAPVVAANGSFSAIRGQTCPPAVLSELLLPRLATSSDQLPQKSGETP